MPDIMRLQKYNTRNIHQVVEIRKDSLEKILKPQGTTNNKYPDVISSKGFKERF